MAKEYPNQPPTPPPDNDASEAAAALLSLIRRADQQLHTVPDLTGKALDARNTFAKIAQDLAVQKF